MRERWRLPHFLMVAAPTAIRMQTALAALTGRIDPQWPHEGNTYSLVAPLVDVVRRYYISFCSMSRVTSRAVTQLPSRFQSEKAG